MPRGYVLHLQALDNSSLGERRAAGLPIRIGRNPLNDCQVSQNFISDFHAIIEEVSGRISVRDLNSKNGIFVRTAKSGAPTRVASQASVDLAAYDYEFFVGPFLRVKVEFVEEDDFQREPRSMGPNVLGRMLDVGLGGAPPVQYPSSPPPFAQGASPPPFGAGAPPPQFAGASPPPFAPGASPPAFSGFSPPQYPPHGTPPAAGGLPSLPLPQVAPLPPMEQGRGGRGFTVPPINGPPAYLPPGQSPGAGGAYGAGSPGYGPPGHSAPQPAYGAQPAYPAYPAQPAYVPPAPQGAAGFAGTGHITLGLEALALQGLRELTASLVPGVPLETTGDIARLITKLHDTVEVFCRCFIPLREGYAQFVSQMDLQRAAMQRSVNRSRGYMAIESAKHPGQVATALLHWREPSFDAPKAVEGIFADLMIHQVALLDGVMQGVRALLDELSPENIEKRVDEREPRGPLGLNLAMGRYKAVWETYRDRFQELSEEKQAFSHIFGPEFTDAYREYRRKRSST